MRVYRNPPRLNWEGLLERPKLSARELEAHVQRMLDQVKQDGDKALIKYSKEFDRVDLLSFEVTAAEIADAVEKLDPVLKEAIVLAKNNIEAFHRPQFPAVEMIATMPGIQCWRKAVAIEKVGLYIPGGTAPLFSTILMLGIPAAIAGCKEVVLCSPPSPDGSLHPAILFAAQLVGVHRIFKLGGVQAIGAMAYGTEQFPKVYKIFGPGNQYVTFAKQIIQRSGIAIDMPAGPSEVAVLADDTANPDYVAADLLSQAEHGIDSQVVLVTTSGELIDKVQDSIQRQLEALPRKELAEKTLHNSTIMLLDTIDEAMDLLNDYAPEHLILNCQNPVAVSEKVINAGSVFIGAWSPESVGDYASGTNHTLPTNGYAKAYSGVSVDSFVKKITFQQLNQEGLQAIGPSVELMAAAEGLDAHRLAVAIRLIDISSQNISI